MTSAGHPLQPPGLQQQQVNASGQAQTPSNNKSPPSKRDLKSWWKGFKLAPKHQEPNAPPRHQDIFGVPLRQSIQYANVAISLVDDQGLSYIYGYVPIVVAKCGVFLKEKATEIEGIFRLAGSEKRIKELKMIFDTPDRYGKGLIWDGYTVHDAANVLRRYLNDLPEPVVPLDLYDKFREPLKGATKQAVGDAEGPQFVDNFDMDAAIIRYQQLIKELPPLNRQLLLYVLDLLAVFAAKSDMNRMNSQNLAAIFQPGILSHPAHAMAPAEYRLNQCVLIFLIENQDHFLIGMQGTAADEKTVQEVQKGAPIVHEPSVSTDQTSVARSASNASAGAHNVAKEGSLRRNKSVSSRHSRRSQGTSPRSSASTPTGALARSNTVPSKKSPGMQSTRFAARHNFEPSPVAQLTPVTPRRTGQTGHHFVLDERDTSQAFFSPTYIGNHPPAPPDPSLSMARNRDRLLDPSFAAQSPPQPKERKVSNLFQRHPPGDSEGRQPNKLRKKRVPGSTSPSAHSSASSLQGILPGAQIANPVNGAMADSAAAGGIKLKEKQDTPPESTPRVSQMASTGNLHPHDAEHAPWSKKSPPTSLHSSLNDFSDLDHADETGHGERATDTPDQERKKRWRLSRRKDEISPGPLLPLPSPGKTLAMGLNAHADASTSSVGSASQKGRTLANESAPSDLGTLYEDSGKESKDDSKSLTGWIKSKYREHKENSEQKRNKSPEDGASQRLAMVGKGSGEDERI